MPISLTAGAPNACDFRGGSGGGGFVYKGVCNGNQSIQRPAHWACCVALSCLRGGDEVHWHVCVILASFLPIRYCDRLVGQQQADPTGFPRRRGRPLRHTSTGTKRSVHAEVSKRERRLRR
ncbi:unnamed protein product [Ectocarpus sp. 4 AP-2014]